MSITKKGKCFLVGAGPGDPGLATLRGKELLEQADVIVYDALVNPEMLGWARPDAEIIFAGKRPGEKTFSQDEINALLIEKTRLGKNVVRLKGGDPFVFGRGGKKPKRWWRRESILKLCQVLHRRLRRRPTPEFPSLIAPKIRT